MPIDPVQVLLVFSMLASWLMIALLTDKIRELKEARKEMQQSIDNLIDLQIVGDRELMEGEKA